MAEASVCSETISDAECEVVVGVGNLAIDVLVVVAAIHMRIGIREICQQAYKQRASNLQTLESTDIVETGSRSKMRSGQN